MFLLPTYICEDGGGGEGGAQQQQERAKRVKKRKHDNCAEDLYRLIVKRKQKQTPGDHSSLSLQSHAMHDGRRSQCFARVHAPTLHQLYDTTRE